MREKPSKRRLFAEHYVKNGFNGTRAYRSAGYQGNENVAAANASMLVRNHKVKDWIDELLAEAQGDRLTPELARSATLDYLRATKGKKDLQAWARAVEMANRATGNYSSTVNVNDMKTDNVLRALKGAIPDHELAELAAQHGIDPKELGITEH